MSYEFEPGMPFQEPGAPLQEHNPIKTRLTPSNAKYYIGCNIVFRTRNTQIVKRILGVSPSGRSIRIDHPDLKDSLEIVSRNVYIL